MRDKARRDAAERKRRENKELQQIGLPPGWRVEVRPSHTGTKQDKCYIAPDGTQYTSLVEAVKASKVPTSQALPNASRRVLCKGQDSLAELVVHVVKADPRAITRVLEAQQKQIDSHDKLTLLLPALLNQIVDVRDNPRLLAQISRGVGRDILQSSKLRLMHLAAHVGDSACIQLLLSHRACPSVTNSAGLTPMHLAAANGSLSAIKLLARADSKTVDAVDNEGPEHTLIGDQFVLSTGFQDGVQ